MIPPFSRVTVLDNWTEQEIHIKERRWKAAEGWFSSSTKLKPLEKKEISATMFHLSAMESARPTVLPIFADGVETTIVLTPQDFINHVKIIFDLDNENQVVVRGVKARLSDLGRLRGLGFLLGREYQGRKEEDIT